jgi:hypothetical protein
MIVITKVYVLGLAFYLPTVFEKETHFDLCDPTESKIDVEMAVYSYLIKNSLDINNIDIYYHSFEICN